MKLLRDLPIRRKLVLIIMLVTGGALLLAGLGLLGLDYLRLRRELLSDLRALAEIAAQTSTAALTFDDVAAAQETLAALGSKSQVTGAAVYDRDGTLFTSWVRPGEDPDLPASPPAEAEGIRGGSAVVVQPILLEGEPIGFLYLASGLGELWHRLWLRMLAVAAVFLVAAAVALAVSSALQGLISRPILALAATARAVSEENDYSIRAARRGGDEIGRLVDAFNSMLAQIEERDTALLAAKEDLEHRVQERTRELQSANVELHQSNRELDDFAYIASHDLKEPLRGIHNYSVFLLEDYADKLDADGRAKLETLTRLTRRMEVLIDSLLQFSRLGRVDLAVDEVDLNQAVAEVLDSLGINLRAEGVEIEIPRPLPTVRADRIRVGEIFHNLIVNAVKYNDKEHKRVEIGYLDGLDGFDGLAGAGRVDRGGGPVAPNGGAEPPVFYVRDNGIGIQEKHFESIFRIFKRLHGREKYGGGTGAGLTIVKKIIERHSGRIWVESRQGEGTTFYFTLAEGGSLAEHTKPADPPGGG